MIPGWPGHPDGPEARRDDSLRHLTGVILAGGTSRRMGTDKALLTLGGSTFIELIARTLTGIVGDVMISAGDVSKYRNFNLPVISDLHPGCGPLGGIHAALSSVPTGGALIVSCDMPLITGAECERLGSALPANDVVIARWGGRLHPLPGIYRKAVLPVLERRLAEGRYSVLDFIGEVPVTVVDLPETAAVSNINTRGEYQSIRAAVSGPPVPLTA